LPPPPLALAPTPGTPPIEGSALLPASVPVPVPAVLSAPPSAGSLPPSSLLQAAVTALENTHKRAIPTTVRRMFDKVRLRYCVGRQNPDYQSFACNKPA
jgi:hypothetical protein